MVAANVEYLNHQFAAELREPIQFGIGIHGGEVIVGDIGFRDHTVFTALGDAVNVAARLQDMTKSAQLHGRRLGRGLAKPRALRSTHFRERMFRSAVATSR